MALSQASQDFIRHNARNSDETKKAMEFVVTLATTAADKDELRALWKALNAKLGEQLRAEAKFTAECYFCHGTKVAYLYPNHFATEYHALPEPEFQGVKGRVSQCPVCKGVGRVTEKEAALRRR